MSKNKKLNSYFDPLISQGSLEYYGKRPWRPGKVSIEPPGMQLEQKGIKALLFCELVSTDSFLFQFHTWRLNGNLPRPLGSLPIIFQGTLTDKGVRVCIS